MEYKRELELDQATLTLRIKPSTTTITGGFEFEGSVDLEVPRDGTAERYLIEGRENCKISNSVIVPSHDPTPISILATDPDSPISMEICRYPSEAEAEITFPALSLLKAGWGLVEYSAAEVPSAIDRLTDEDDEASKIFDFIYILAPSMSYDDFIQLLESLSGVSPAFRFRLGNQLEDLLRDMVARVSLGRHFPITSFEQLESRARDIESFPAFKKLDREIDSVSSIGYALAKLQERGEARRIAEVVDQLEVDRHAPDLLLPPQVAGLLARRIDNGDIEGAKHVVQACIGSAQESEESYKQLKEEAFDASTFEDRQTAWEKALSAVDPESEQFEFSAAQYLHWTARVWETTRRKFEPYSKISGLLYMVAGNIFRRKGFNLAQYSEYYYHLSQGVRYRANQELHLAVQDFEAAYEIAADLDDYWGRKLYRSMIRAFSLKTQTLADEERQSSGTAEAVDAVDNHIQFFEAITVPDDEKELKSKELANLRGLYYSLKTDLHLENNEFELALETAGQTIKCYVEAERDRSKEWAITKRKQIKAVLAEKEGKFDAAVTLHREVSEEGETKESTRNWHGYRTRICEAKQLAIGGEYRIAKEALMDDRNESSPLIEESKDLGIILDAAIAFQEGESTDIRTSLEELTPPDETTDDPRPLNIAYNYEAALSVLTAGQRLAQVNVDHQILSMLAEVALRDAFINVNVGDVASDVGLDYVDLENRWKVEIPAPVARRIAQIELEEDIPTTDYMGRATRVLGTLELYLAIFVEYHARRHWKSDWKAKLTSEDKDKKLSIGDLLGFFPSEAAESLRSVSDVRTILDRDIVDRTSIAQLRNDLSHEHVESLSQEEYIEVRSRVTDLITTTSPESPIIGEIENSFPVGDFYAVRLHWWHPRRQTLVRTTEAREVGEYYYLPRDPLIRGNDLNVISVESDEMIRVSTDRVISNVSQVPS